MDPWAIWLAVAAVSAVAEILTLTAALGMLAAASAVTAVAAALGMPVPLQFLTFTVVTTVMVLLLQPVAMRHLHRPQKARFGVDALVGKAAYAVTEVTSRSGRIDIDGEVWTARPYDETLVIPSGATVDVMEIRGATAIVYPRE
ncbi:membrane protein implicated in regulation of membrane protease activity [Streptomyces sp. 3330]|uniref:NfeD family protein n=1 Tax=Streptomyces sp. 3330 TaxID=2817755 RepID=UPI0028655006|nr:NfeD family protein [Streptomyces sp. 3330]MDR6980970.1 membrane protein implicated in regulation of membrane protease activity [Streptomyces sp. 3330]